ncbi:DNA repair protein RecN [Actinobacillus delphinicola]|uniref:DNA repair protein RecN n=1 Tax=Actinobacillus delphinicola TaxID=51161 RepID=UPI002442E88F|nr:DNA repair protein RecN [Actinobacillus delphinicola]MDG6896516.1 DNA repair protein RecN [Actinobacillus delphinicola]
MLTQLTINHFAIVHHVDIEFATGMSVITGETGAGKSIALDALGVCLGQRTDSTMLRDNENRADICAVFHISPENPAYTWLIEQELQDTDNPENCILRRVISPDGRSKSFINSTPVSAQQLKLLGQFLVQINGQHAAQQLLKPEYQMQLLDCYCEHTSVLNQMQADYSNWKNLQQQVATFHQKCQENAAKKQLLEYQVAELDEFAVKENEYEELEKEHTRLSNSETLSMLSQSASQLLSENEEVNIESLLYRATQHIGELVELDTQYAEVNTLLQEALIQIQEASSELQILSSNIEQDPALLQDVEDRLSQCINLARKHNVKPEALYQLHQQLKQELTELVDFSESEQTLIEEENKAYRHALETAERLHQSRMEKATVLSQQVTENIQKLAMENAIFSIELNFDENKLTAKGADSIAFNLRSNLGQQAQALNKTASGGELSRIALTLQVLTSHKNAIPTLIFDEIDVGISGATASVVGQLLRNLGAHTQVICVTHLPQVACCGHHHFAVEKHVVNDKTETMMKKLTPATRVHALAKLLGGSEITETALANAEEMLALVS